MTLARDNCTISNYRRRYLPLLLLSIVLIGTIGTAGSAGQQVAMQPNAFRTEANFVEVHAIVTDTDGRFVRNLTIDDFEIHEDGNRQAPATFSLIEVPVGPASATTITGEPLEWDLRESTGPFDGRIYILVLDELHTSLTRSQQVRDAARAFIEKYFGPNDLATVVFTTGRREAGQELTNNRRLLLAAIDRFQGNKLPSAGAEKLALHMRQEDVQAQSAEAQVRTVEGLQRGQSVRDPYDAERRLSARRALKSIENVATWFSDVSSGRKSLLLFSEGFAYDIYEPFAREGADSVLLDVRQAVAAAQRANVTVYGIDPRGLNQFGELVDVKGYSDYPQLQYGTFRGSLNELLLSQESLISLSEQTGGLAIVNAGDVTGGLGRIVLDSSRYYLLGYHSESTGSQQRFLKIDVKVKRPGLEVRARRGYFPSAPNAAVEGLKAHAGTSAALGLAMGKPLPGGSLPLRVTAAPFKGTGKLASVVIALEIDGRALTFRENEDRYHNTLEVSIVASDEKARVQGGDHQTFKMQLLPDTHDWLRSTGLRFMSRLSLPPGRYQIRVGAHEIGSGAVAMVPYDLEVPDYSRAVFDLSGILLTSSEAEQFATSNADPELLDLLPAPPVVRRRFTASEALTIYVEAYGRSSSLGEIGFALTLLNTDDFRPVFATSGQGKGKTTDSGSAVGFTAAIPLKDLGQGNYLLRIEATSAAGRAIRELPLNVGEPGPAGVFRVVVNRLLPNEAK